MATSTFVTVERSPRRALHDAATRHGPLLGTLVALCAALTVESQNFLTTGNFRNLGIAISYIGIMAAPCALVVIAGGIDLSVGALAGLVGQALAFGLTQGLSVWVAIALSLVVAAACGGINSLLIVRLGVNAVVGTIATQFIFLGAAFAWGGGGSDSTAVSDPVISTLGNGDWLGIPVPAILMIVIFVVVGCLFKLTVFGSNLSAVGGSQVAARLAGIPVARTRTLVYVLSSVCAGLAGIVLVGIDGASVPDAAIGVELNVLAAVVIGGTSLIGGVGSVFGAFLGVVGLGVLQNGLNLLGVSAFGQQVSTGGALLLAMIADSLRERRREARG